MSDSGKARLAIILSKYLLCSTGVEHSSITSIEYRMLDHHHPSVIVSKSAASGSFDLRGHLGDMDD